nr:SDR family oxidoreductase [Kordiimonas pumila]
MAVRGMGCKAGVLQLDVAKQASFVAFADALKTVLHETWGRDTFDYLVNNAGAGVNVPYVDTSVEQFDMMMNIHMKGPFFLSQSLLPLITNGGSILNVSSGLTRFSMPGYAAYAAMKGAVEVMTRYMAKELGSRNITVNVVAPGAIETDFGGGVVRDNKLMNQAIAQQTALGRVGLPDDIGKVVSAFLSGDNRWINGQRLEASGGMFL